MRRRTAAGVLLLAMATAAGVVASTAPAAWVADAVAARGPVRLAYPAGNVWCGSAIVGLWEGEHTIVLPGRLRWRLSPWPLLRGQVALSLEHPAMDNAVRVVAEPGVLEVSSGKARIPAAFLEAFGAPFNTLRPGGELHMTWPAWRVTAKGAAGRGELVWRDASSALSPIVPLGHYRLTFGIEGARGEAQLQTLDGPLRVEGTGAMDAQRIRFSGRAETPAPRREALAALLGVIGKPMGDKVLLEWEVQR